MLIPRQDISCVIGVALFCCCCSFVRGQESLEPAQPDSTHAAESAVAADLIKSPTGAMLRSLALPGWGQFYNEQWIKGICVAGTELGIIANAIVQNHYAANANTDAERDFYRENRNLSYWWLAGTILLSMADAYVDAHLYGFDESTELSVDLKRESAPFHQQVSVLVTINLIF
jgi:hypothetical protein